MILVTSRPAAESALIAASLPEPGPLTITSTDFKPCIKAALVAVSAFEVTHNDVDICLTLYEQLPSVLHKE